MPLANRFRLCLLHCVTKVSHTVDTARARQVASRPLPLSLGVPLVTRRNAANDTGDGYTQVYIFINPIRLLIMATKANNNGLSKMVSNGTSTSRSCVSDASDTSVSNLNAGSNSALDAASEKNLNMKYASLKQRYTDYLLIFELNHRYAVLKEDASCLFSLGLTAQVAGCMVFEDCELDGLLGDIVSAGKKAALVSPLNA